MKKVLVVVLSLILIMSLVACGGNNDYAMNEAAKDYNYESEEMSMDEMDMDMAPAEDGGFGNSSKLGTSVNSSEPEVTQVRKIIKNAYMEIQTLEYDSAILVLQDKVASVGGYIESSDVTGTSLNRSYETRYARFTLRIPSNVFIGFLADMNEVGNIVMESSSGQDITSQYIDTEARVKTLEVQEERLLDILSKADKIEDVISLERALSDVRYQIESYKSSLKHWDNLVSYATLNVNIQEVIEITEKEEIPKTLGEKIASTFRRSLDGIKRFFENTVIFIIGNIPYLIIYLPIIIIIYLVINRIRKREKKITKQLEENNESK
jgi:hypothetical protein